MVVAVVVVDQDLTGRGLGGTLIAVLLQIGVIFGGRIYWVYKMKTMMMMMMVVKGCVYRTKQVMVRIMFLEEDEGLVVRDQAETIRDKKPFVSVKFDMNH